MSQLQGDSAPTRLPTSEVVHLALWSSLLHVTRCGVSFDLDQALHVEGSVSCMTCLVRADLFEIPLYAAQPATNPDGESVWCKQVFGPPCNRITECCYAEDPCDWHKSKQS